jgi:Leucine-rich repeat (LRR) protein
MQLHQLTSPQLKLNDSQLYVFQNIPFIEWRALQDLYNDNNGVHWDWSKFPESGVPWDFPLDSNETLYPNPCTEQWQGIECSCYLNLGVNAAHPRGQNSEFVPLEEGYYSYYYDYYLPDTSYLSTDNSSTSIEVSCSVTKLQLVQHNLKGHLSPSITLLANLTHLKLDINELSGNLTDILMHLPKLTCVTLAHNLFSGTFPSSVVSLTDLRTLSLSCNKLYGSLPSELRASEHFYIDENQFSGTLPASLFAEPCSMVIFTLRRNHFSGNIPEEITNCHGLQVAGYGENFFGDQFPWFFLTSFPSLIFLNGWGGFYPISFFDEWVDLLRHFENENDTRLETIPTDLYFMDFGSNHLKGDFTEDHMIVISKYYPNIGEFSVDTNSFHGSIPSNIYLLSNTLTFYFSINYFTGTLPSCLNNMTSLTDLRFTENYLHGTIPEEMFTNLPELKGMYLQQNLFSGTIPERINQSISLTFFTVVSNHLTGTIPSTLFTSPSLQTVQLSANRFTGSISLPSDLRSNEVLQSLDISRNLLTGTIPVSVFLTMKKLNGLFIIDNCLDSSPHAVKSLLPNVCLSKSLQRVALDGMSAASPQCVSKDSQFVVKERITIPECLFRSPQLISLSLSGNNLQGTLPSLNVSSTVLDSLILSHNRFTGTIPASYQHHSWNILDLSYNRISGSLVTSSAFGSIPNKTNVLLEANRLSGTIPTVYHSSIRNLSLLNGNFFTCSYKQRELPQHDSFRHVYSCGTNSLNILLFTWIGLLLISIAFYNGKNIQSLVMSNDNRTITEFYKYWKIITRYSSQQFEEVYKEFYSQSPFLYYNLVSFEVIRQCLVTYGGFTVAILMVLYGILGISYKSHEFSYAYTLSSAFFTGIVPAVLLFFFWSLSLFIVERMIYRIQPYHRKAQYFSMKTDFSMFNKATVVPTVDYETILANKMNRNRQLNWKNVPFLRNVFLLMIVCLSLFVMIILMNIGFLYTQTHFINYYKVLSQCAMSGMKILFSRVVLPFILSWMFSYFLELDLFLKEVSEARQASSRNDANHSPKEMLFLSPYQEKKMKMEWCYSYQFILEILFGIGINIIAPCIATAIYDISCFYNVVFEKPPIVEVNYIITIYRAYFSLNSTSVQVPFTSDSSSSYQPLFTYSYQCSSVLLTNYIFVFVFMIVSDTFVKPCVKWLVGRFKDYRMKRTNTIYPINDRSWNGKEKPLDDGAVDDDNNSHEDKCRNDADKDDGSDKEAAMPIGKIGKSNENTFNRKRKEKLKLFMLPLKENSILTNFLNYFSILMTFGLMFPPLGLFIVVYLTSLLGTYIQLIVKFFERIRNAPADLEGLFMEERSKRKTFELAVVKLSEKKLSSCLSLLIVVFVYVLIPFTLVFFHFFLFDILADHVGWEIAMLITVITCVACITCHMFLFIHSPFTAFRSSISLSMKSRKQTGVVTVTSKVGVDDYQCVKEESADNVVEFDENDVDSSDGDVELADAHKNDPLRSTPVVPSSSIAPYRHKQTELRRTALSNDSPSVDFLIQTMEFETLLEELDLLDRYYDSASDILTILLELMITM